MDYVESDLDFSPLFNHLDKKSFYIEKSSFHDKSKNLKTVEFITIDGEKVYFIEAKRSVPREATAFCEEIYEKFYHSLNLIVTNELKTGKFANHDLPEGFKDVFANRKIIFVLIIPSIPEEHRLPIKLALEEKFFSNSTMSLIWDISIMVENEKTSKENRWIK